MPIAATAQAPDDMSPNPSLRQVLDRGRALYIFDRAAWVTSDELIARLPNDRHAEVGGWVVTPGANAIHIDYFGKAAAADRVIFAADVSSHGISNQIVYPAASAPLLTEPAGTMAKALRAAWSELGRHPDWKPCTNAPFNTVVLPPSKDGIVPVYFLTPQTQTRSYPFGGHYEVDIARNGEIGSTRAFTQSCITITRPPESEGASSAAVFITHLLDPHPTEIHLFEQYCLGVPIFVSSRP